MADSILKLHREDEKAFRLNFSAAAFKERFATERQEQGNPFEGAAELDESNFEWRRRLILPHARCAYDIICCPEDVEMSNGCQHSLEELCPRCRLPLCWRCSSTMLNKSGSRVVPMGLCNDNLWGYTTDVISKYQVRWIETAIVSPCWTTMLVYYVEGDRGHLMGEEVGQQQFRTKVRSTSCSFHMT